MTTRPPENLPCFAVTAPGLEPVTRAELARLGLPGQAIRGGVEFAAGRDRLLEANLELRSPTRILVRIAAFRATAFYELEKRARRVDWERYIGTGRPVAFRVTARGSRLYHEGAIEQRLLETANRAGAVTAPPMLADEEGERAQLFVVRVANDRVSISVDASGAPLHRRGYRQALAKAPLRETLAAAMLLASGWDASQPLLDPLCGSGTIPIEAALMARRIPPGLANAGLEPRPYAFQQWQDHDPALWGRVLEQARERILPRTTAPILASDRDAGAIRATRTNAERAGVTGAIEAMQRPISALETTAGPGWLVTNPPYGKRIGDSDALRDLYAAFGNLARARLAGWTIALLSADRRLEGQLGLPLQPAFATRNGGIPVRLMVGEVPRGP